MSQDKKPLDQAKEAVPGRKDTADMPLGEHLAELRRRLLWCVIVIAALIGPAYYFSKDLFRILLAPLTAVMPPDSSLIYTTLPEGFLTYLKIAVVAALLVASPFVFYQIWAFVAPGLHKEEKRFLVPIALLSALCFAAGAVFGYLVVFPMGFQFFMSFADDMIKPMPRLADYLSLALMLLFAFGLAFELPIFMLILGRLGLISSKKLKKYRGYAYIAAFIVGAILTPPDVISQICLAVPLLILFELSIVLVKIFGKKEKKDAKDAST